MTRHRIQSPLTLSLLAGLAFAVGCAHDKPPVATRPAPAPPATAEMTGPRVVAPAAGPAAAAPGLASGAIYFDLDSALLRDDARSFLKKVATTLSKQEKESLVIEGNCDELGTVEYNLALGEQRASSAKDYLDHLGVPPERIHTLSYGAQRPRFPGHDDASRAKNRRDDLRVQ